jgi:glycosyltransferase involved in cell wall biosynthesis
MPVFNCAPFIRESIESILNQSYTHFYLHIVNDGSTDSTEEIIKEFNDPRIRYFNNSANIKLISTLNLALTNCKTKYIVRMDGDDIADTNYIQKLYDFMEENPKISVCSCYFEYFGNKTQKIINPIDEKEVKVSLLFFNPVCHPGIWRNEIIQLNNLGFNKEYVHAEEYEFWTQIADISELANIPFFLLKIRAHESQVSRKFEELQLNSAKKVRAKLLNNLLNNLSEQDFELWEEIITNNSNFKEPLKTILLIEKIIKANTSLVKYNQDILIRKLAIRWKNANLELEKVSLYYLFQFYIKLPKIKTRWSPKQLLYMTSKIVTTRESKIKS